MPSRYDASTKVKAIRLVREHRAGYPTEYAAITAVAGRLGMSAETLRLWIRRDEADSGQAAGVSAEESKEICDLNRKVRELPAAYALADDGEPAVAERHRTATHGSRSASCWRIAVALAPFR